MALTRERTPIQRYLAELTRLRALTADQLAQEVDDLAPLWVAVKVVPEL